MINCHISFPNSLTHLIQIELNLSAPNEDNMEIILPAWRPGRYELAPFSENIHRFEVLSKHKEKLKWHKTKPNIWTLDTQGHEDVIVRYQYFANKLDAGNSVLDDQMIYINFINCIMYSLQDESQPYQLTIDIPKDFQVACSLKRNATGEFVAKNFQELVDAPLLAAESLKTISYGVKDYKFEIYISGNYPLSDAEILTQFKKFTTSQVEAFGNFPTPVYQFIIFSLDYRHYHGVEHQNSTVLVLGPNEEKDKAEYLDKLLGVASHELFHTWNVTRIRPAEMSPYQFDSETITETGFVTEGFTTYYGDYFLKKSGVFTQEEYFKEINTFLKRHFENYGRFETSLIESSRNLWVDGYKNVIPTKKVSIYIKGALCALILDLEIRKSTHNAKTLMDVIKQMYERYTCDKGGYTKNQVYQLINEIGGEHMADLTHQLYETTADLAPILSHSLISVGCELKAEKHPDEFTSKLGIKITEGTVQVIAPESLSAKVFSIGDMILKINEKEFEQNAKLNSTNEFLIKRGSRTLNVSCKNDSQTYFDSFNISVVQSANEQQSANLIAWLGNNLK